jgi:hypothetical protein
MGYFGDELAHRGFDEWGQSLAAQALLIERELFFGSHNAPVVYFMEKEKIRTIFLQNLQCPRAWMKRDRAVG